MVLSAMPSSIELVENLTDLLVMDDHAVAVGILAALAEILFRDVGAKMHRRGIVPEEEGLIRLGLLFHPCDRAIGDLLVDGFHALLGERTGVRDRLPALAVGQAMQHAAGTELLLERRIPGIVRQFRLFLRVEVIEIAEEFVETMHGRQELVAVAQMVLAELAGGVAQRLEQFGDRRIFLLQTDCRARHADLGQARADRILPGDEAGASGSAALLGIIVGESDTLSGDTVDVRRSVAHHAEVEPADVPHPDVVAPQDKDVWFLCSHGCLSSSDYSIGSR